MSFNNTNSTSGADGQTPMSLLWSIALSIGALLTLLGIFGNCLSVVVLSRKAMRSRVSSLFLTSLSIVDTMALLAVYTFTILPSFFAVDVATTSTFSCKMEFTLLHGFHDMSSWILVAITGERTLAVVFPFKSRSLVTRKRVFVILIAIALGTLALNSWFIYGYEIQTVSTEANGTVTVCLFTDTSGFIYQIWPAILALKTAVLPGTLMLVGSLWIIATLWKTARQASRHGTQTTASSSVAPISRLLLMLNAIYLLTTTPFNLHLIMNPDFYTSSTPGYQKVSDSVVLAVAYLFNVNHFTNFIVYHLQGPLFRAELRAMFSCPRTT